MIWQLFLALFQFTGALQFKNGYWQTPSNVNDILRHMKVMISTGDVPLLADFEVAYSLTKSANKGTLRVNYEVNIILKFTLDLATGTC